MTRFQEEYVFNAFAKLYSELPSGQYIRGEQPDYVIASHSKTIGVEITQIFIDNHLNSSKEKKKESLRSIFGDKLCERLQGYFSFKFILSVDFSLKDFSLNEIDKIVFDCCSYLTTIQFPQNFISIDIVNLGQLPDEIEVVSFFYNPSSNKSFFSESAGGVLPDLTIQHLKTVLNKKHKALKKYRKCDEQWLLIEEGTFFADSFGAISIEEFETEFQKVFLYRHAKGELLILK